MYILHCKKLYQQSFTNTIIFALYIPNYSNSVANVLYDLQNVFIFVKSRKVNAIYNYKAEVFILS